MPPDGSAEIDARIPAWAALCDALEGEADPLLDPLAGGILAAVALGLTGDSRSFARDFGIAHALVLREVNMLAEEAGLITVTRQDARTQRSHLVLSAAGKALVDRLTAA